MDINGMRKLGNGMRKWGILSGLTGIVILYVAMNLLVILTDGGPMFMVVSKIPAVYVGVTYSLVGGVQEGFIGEGINLKTPWESIALYTVRTQERKESASVPSSEGLIVTLDTSILYRLHPDMASNVHRTIGPMYDDIVVAPQARSITRGMTAEYEAKALYTSEREVLASRIYEQLKPVLEDRGIILEKVLLRDIQLPTKIKDAIENKLDAEQQAERMEFVLQKEEQEKQRRIIEAEGIAEANRIIANSLTKEYLTWYWIENLKNHNSVLYVPVGEGGMPLFKDIDTASPSNT